MEFQSQEAAYSFYNRYAAKVGFSVRKDSTSISRTGTREVIDRTFCCSLQGSQDPRCKPKDQRKRNRADTRTGCKAKISLRKKDELWVVTKFVEEHNHNHVPPSKRHKLRSLRRMTENLMTRYESLEDEKSCKIGFTLREATNYLSTKRQSEVRKGDVEEVLYHLECQQLKSPAFFYAIQVDSEVGMNHQCKTVLFGVALLFNDSEESLTWLVKTWMNTICVKQPKVIFTDLDSAIGSVIEREMTGTHQRYCLWNIMRTAKQNLQHIMSAQKDFTTDFSNCLYHCETEGEFEYNWAVMLGKYGLANNNQCQENAYFDGYLRRDMPLLEFLKQLENAVIDSREAENDADFESNHAMPLLKLSTDIEKEAAIVYTAAIFQKFQDQLLECLSYRHKKVVEIGTKSTYNVWKTGYEHKNCSVTFDNHGTYAKCSYAQGTCMLTDCKDAAMVRYHKLCQEAINVAIKGSMSTDVYKVAMRSLHHALREVETSLRNVSSCTT
ncbi:hypothetical protein AQUCO_01700705v1 [Aquilegia coerulea]|uniref:Protein FAR1-RELATED SEQUENCE n=1 Tax=Aquilegia coerulea TaxID=218851 RepID=A0A2G5DP93_AQUCA|nr:hypothetical protein AQUCO_01700705v1 [Aquilegia coerulea]